MTQVFRAVHILRNALVDPQVYNGTRKVEAGDSMFMNSDDVMLCVKSIKIKNSEGYDRIPQRVLVDGITSCCMKHLTVRAGLFFNIYLHKLEETK